MRGILTNSDGSRGVLGLANCLSKDRGWKAAPWHVWEKTANKHFRFQVYVCGRDTAGKES